jgi:sensor c-di-GMP phosphodiesterase-like protein
VAVLCGLIGGAIPIALMAWLSWNSAVEIEQARLRNFAQSVLERSKISLNQSYDALYELNASTLALCSPEHIALMRKLTVNTRSVDEIGYSQSGVLKCTSWGLVDPKVESRHMDNFDAARLKVKLSMQPGFAVGDKMLSVQMAEYNALINAGRFGDIVVDEGVQLALARDDGMTVIGDAGSNAGLMQSILRNEVRSAEKDFLFAKAFKNGWTAVAATPVAALQASLKKQQQWMMPLGAFISLFIVVVTFVLARKRLSPEAELKRAVARGEFEVHYQPIMDLHSGRCVGAEALVRWRKRNGAMVNPDLFIPLAEKTGLIKPITDQVIHGIVRDLGETLAKDRSMHVSLNLCADDIRTGRVLPVIDAALAGTDIRHEQIWLEATERSYMDIDSAKETLNKARRSGHSTAIDDFGTGYSSLQYLQGLPMDAIKIDKSFVATIGTGSAASSVIGHIIDIAKSLKMFIIAEGVETQEQADYLAKRQVELVQGWLFSKALPAQDFLIFYARAVAFHGPGPYVIQRSRRNRI